MSRSVHVVGLVCFLIASSFQFASAQTTVVRQGATTNAQALAAKIDQYLAKRAAEAQVTPARLANDAEFLRRVYLDLTGRIPSVAETRTFLADDRPDRRTKVVDRLLSSSRYAIHFASIYRSLLIPEARNNIFVRAQQEGFEGWLRKQLSANVGYDRMTRELLTETVSANDNFEIFGSDASVAAFYAAKEYKPESLAAGVARVFLGVRVECAQCHNHPFADWNKEQFWSLAAFFSGLQGQRNGDVVRVGKENRYKRELTIPGSEKVVQARFLDGSNPNWDTGATTRATFADWVTSPSNPFFARAAVNRTWAYFFGTGLVEPIDEMVGTSTVSSHAELLDLLAREFMEHKFDLKFLMRTITLTQAYQRTSSIPRGDKTKLEPTLFARMPVRGLTPEQLFDSLVMATGYRVGDSNILSEIYGGDASPRAQFLAKFENQVERATMAQTSILQALTLMNGKLVTDATSLRYSETLAALVDAPFLDTAERLEALYLATLSRRPTARELERASRFVEDAVRDAKDRDAEYALALSDVFWALLNSSEFALNH